ncbi:hypothetical protein BLOT_001959 [Blomia tropicalis]|nr:hypothetical protein BLOT_001959 [Blomia tropicalis]
MSTALSTTPIAAANSMKQTKTSIESNSLPLESMEPLATSPIKLRHNSSTSTSTSSSLDENCFNCSYQEPNELILDPIDQSTIAIEVPASTLRIELGPFRSVGDVHAEPGDIIEIDRILSSHWAIYVGDGDAVHVVGTGEQEVPDSEIAIVQRLPLTTIAGENYCRVNNKILRAKERNMLPFHNEIVVRKVLSKVGCTVPYNVLQCNSEHYVTEWKYGHRWSDQAAVSLNSFKALRRQHTNSLSEGHTLFVNTLNEVLNSPSISTTSASSPSVLVNTISPGSSNSSMNSSSSSSSSSSNNATSCTTPPPPPPPSSSSSSSTQTGVPIPGATHPNSSLGTTTITRTLIGMPMHHLFSHRPRQLSL